MTWTPEIVRARFVEACDTERRLPKTGGGGQGAPWPAYMHTFEDMNGWGTKRLAEEREMRMARIPPSAAAITRFDEVMKWSADLIADERRRRIIWAWAWCRLSGSSFSNRCRKHGWVKVTAYRRLTTAFSAISDHLRTSGALVRYPDEKWVIQEQPIMACSSGTVPVLDDDDAAPNPHFEISDGSRAVHTLTTPESVANFEKFLERTNKARAKEQARRAKLKILDAEVA